jgi:metallo-beta-lactamase family protein
MKDLLSLTFLGTAGTVTGSRYLLRTPRRTLLVDCGLFQGYKTLRLRNRAPFPDAPAEIDRVVLTHAHLDHSGYLPLLVKTGYTGRIFCTAATRDLAAVLLRDSGHLQEREADLANRYGYTRHAPALPLYTEEDAGRAIERFSAVEFGRRYPVTEGVTATFRRAGHILGAATVEIDSGGTSIVFSGDLGRGDSATMPPPEPVTHADYLVVESTYGNRRHDRTDPQDALAAVIERTVARGGTVLIPTFAVGRAQELHYHLAQLKKRGRICAALPVFLDSPMAVDAARIFRAHPNDHRLTPDECRETCGVATYVRDVRESKALNADARPKIVLSASGMATGGRVLHHLETLAPDSRNTILFAGFQAGGTRGAAIVGGAEAVKIHGRYVPIRAQVANLEMLSAHADADEILAWLRRFERAPRMTFITHGEPAAADALRVRVQDELSWPCTVPDHLQRFALE